jgi:hypothetical protein
MMVRESGGQIPGGTDGLERGDLLRLAIFENREIGLCQIIDRLASFVNHRDIDDYGASSRANN